MYFTYQGCDRFHELLLTKTKHWTLNNTRCRLCNYRYYNYYSSFRPHQNECLHQENRVNTEKMHEPKRHRNRQMDIFYKQLIKFNQYNHLIYHKLA